MTAFVEVKVDDTDVMDRLRRIAAKGRDVAPVLEAFGDYLVKETVDRFDTRQDPYGVPWKPISWLTWRYKKNKRILVESTDLRNSFSRKVEGFSLKVGTNRPYAAVHQFGLKDTLQIKAHRRRVKGRSKRGVQSGVAFVKAHDRKVNIQARPFLGFTPGDRQELAQTIKEYMQIVG